MSTSVLFEQHNLTATAVDMNIDKTFHHSLINDVDEKKLTLSRVNIPTSGLENLCISDRSKYFCSLKFYKNANDTYELFTQEMPSVASHGIRFHNKEQIIECLNRCYSSCFRQGLDQMSTDGDANVKKSTGTQALTSGGAITSLSDTQALAPAYTLFSNMTLDITATTLNTLDTASRVRIYVEAPSGEELTCFEGEASFLSSILLSTGGKLSFTEDSFNNVFSDEFVPSPSNYTVKFQESITKFSGITTSGSYKFYLVSDTAFDIDLTYDLAVYCGDLTNLVPTQSPYIARSGDKLQLVCQEMYYKTNSLIGVSSYFKPWFVFNSLPTISDTVNDCVYLQFENISLGTLTDPVVLTQEYSTLENLNNITNIQIESNTLASNRADIIVSDTLKPISSSVLYDFAVLKDSPIGSELSFSQTAVPMKRINLKGMNEIRRIDLSVWAVYSDGTRKLVKLNTNERLQIRLTFF